MSAVHSRSRTSRRAFSLIELIVVIVVIFLVLFILLPAFSTPHHGGGGRQIKDATQLKNIVTALATWAQNNQERYPLPSQLDALNEAIAAPADGQQSKDNTGNILSMLIYNGSVSPAICINPAESNTAQIKDDDGYQYSSPSAAAVPDKAAWDPGFAGTPIDALPYRRTDGGTPVGHQSYAQLIPVGQRLSKWTNSFATTEAIFGDRGPELVESAHPASGKYTLKPGPTGAQSNTLLIHGGRNTWEGNIGYNDAHVTFETRTDPEGVTYRRGAGKAGLVADNLFVDETDETDEKGAKLDATARTNNFLRPIAHLPASGALTQGGSAGSHLWVD